MTPQPLPRAVVDTSVLVPAWSRLLLIDLAARPATYTPIWCEWIIAETWRVLTVQYLQRQVLASPGDGHRLSVMANAMLTTMLPVMEFTSTVPPFDATWPTARDANDAPIWSAAVHSGAGYVISHNLRDFPPRNGDGLCTHQGIEFITAEDFTVEVLGLDPHSIAPRPVPSGGRLGHRRRVIG